MSDEMSVISRFCRRANNRDSGWGSALSVASQAAPRKGHIWSATSSLKAISSPGKVFRKKKKIPDGTGRDISGGLKLRCIKAPRWKSRSIRRCLLKTTKSPGFGLRELKNRPPIIYVERSYLLRTRSPDDSTDRVIPTARLMRPRSVCPRLAPSSV